MPANSKRGLVRTLSLLAGAAVLLGGTAPGDLSPYQGRKRVVVIFSPGRDDPRLAHQEAEVRPLLEAKDDRDLVLVQIIGDASDPAWVSAADLRGRYHVDRAAFRTLLIGKDGGVKLRSDTVIGGKTLAGVIDAMPMRRDEMRRGPR
jgi:hypothetical protein